MTEETHLVMTRLATIEAVTRAELGFAIAIERDFAAEVVKGSTATVVSSEANCISSVGLPCID